ncbi:MAG: serine/threonine protein kinase [Myxococcales bacterium]
MPRTCPDCRNTYDDDVLHCPEDGVSLTGGIADDLIGHSIGSYRVVRLLGKGGMGSVYMAEHPTIGSKVAIKFLHPQYSHDEKIVDRFFNEARAVNVIGHDNILKILDLNVTDDNRHYFVMEFLHGRPLQSLLKGGGAVPLQVAGPILLQVCDALGAAHDAGIVHRDLKPDNIYLISLKGKKNFVKVVDFGIAKLTNSEGVSTGNTQTGMVMGTPAYMSPEQASGRTQLIDARSDVYSLGVMMFQLATGRLPFPGSAFGEVLIGHIQLAPPRPRDLNPAVPEAYETVILRTLQKRQEDRFQSMQQLHEAISRVMDQLGISTELPAAEKNEDMDTIASRGSPSNPGARTPSQPGRSTDPRGGARRSSPGRSQPGSRPRAPAAGRPRATPGRPQVRAQEPEDQPTLPATASHKGRAPLVIGIAAALVLALGGAGFLVSKSLTAAEEAKLAADEVVRTRKTQVQQPPPQAEAEPVYVVVVSDPLEARVKASWKSGEKDGTAPLSIEAPRNAKVHLEITRSGYIPYQADLVADVAQTFTAKMTAVAAGSLTPPIERAPERSARKAPPKKKKKSELPNDGLIDIGDALK